MADKYCYDYPRPAVTADIAVIQWQQDRLNILLIQRGHDPFARQWALPGGFVDIDEPLADAARRELHEETGLSDVPLREFGTAGTPGRDPRGRTISILYYAIVPAGRAVNIQHGDDASSAAWFDIRSLPALAFDHAEVVQRLLDRLQTQALYHLEGFDYFDTFTKPQIALLHEALLGRPIGPDDLLAKFNRWELLEPVDEGRQYRAKVDRLSEIRRGDLLSPLFPAI